MLTEKQIKAIKEHLNKAQNPVFYYDNDADGLCSFLLLRRYLGRGKGIAVRSYPDLNAQYASKARELNADYVFVLDKPVISKEFVQEIDSMQLPLVWIDHHAVAKEKFEKTFTNFKAYNPAFNRGKNKSSEPATYLIYKITDRKEDLWIAIMGCIADHYLPDFAEEFGKEYPELWNKEIKEPFDAYYRTEIGKIAMALNFGLKDSVTHVVNMQNFLVSCKGPEEIFSESDSNGQFRENYLRIRKKYDSLLEKAQESIFGNLIFFDYSGEISISSDIANELSYRNPNKYIAVSYIKGPISNISLRGKNVKRILAKILKKFNDATGGGHKDAVGARIRTEDLAKFREALEKEINSGGN